MCQATTDQTTNKPIANLKRMSITSEVELIGMKKESEAEMNEFGIEKSKQPTAVRN